MTRSTRARERALDAGSRVYLFKLRDYIATDIGHAQSSSKAAYEAIEAALTAYDEVRKAEWLDELIERAEEDERETQLNQRKQPVMTVRAMNASYAAQWLRSLKSSDPGEKT